MEILSGDAIERATPEVPPGCPSLLEAKYLSAAI